MEEGVIAALREGAKVNLKQLTNKLDEQNELIRVNGANDGKESPVRFAALARAMLYYALHLCEEERDSKEKLEPRWRELIDDYNAMCRNIGSNVFPEMENDDGISAFCRFATRRTGNHRKRFYVGLATYSVYLQERGLLDSQFLRVVTPKCESSLPDEWRGVLNKVLSEFVPSKARGKNDIVVKSPQKANVLTMNIVLHYNGENIDRFEDYRHLYVNPQDDHAHFVCYRPSRRSPTRLIKSFLAIGRRTPEKGEEEDRADSLRFVHVYIPPETASGRVPRHSRGRVVPLEDGVYLIGGQREATSRSESYKTMKVIALPWAAIEKRRSLVRALAMSANYDERHIVSKVALRATPIVRSTDLRLGGVPVSDLWNDLKRDAEAELQLMQAYAGDDNMDSLDSSHFSLWSEKPEQGLTMPSEQFLRDRAHAILSSCNNGPDPDHGWDMPPGFEPSNECDSDRSLSRSRLNTMLEETFSAISGNPLYVKYADDSKTVVEEKFNFWTSIRFGPLSQD